ncbi:hypothetical protein [Mucilaginibacter sp. UYCu711]|uniref:hypothetical protein n=1 Tax=Mucilaginibacter sp. UYCu711 TaxID=3156339 RepID=UPI003D1F7627
MKIKDDFHHLIDSIGDEQLLQHYYQLIQNVNQGKVGQLWNNLSDSEKQEVLVAYDESFDNNNLLTHEEVKSEHEKWLKP